MRSMRLSIGLTVLLGILTVTVPGTRVAAQERLLYSFKANGIDGGTPYGGLAFDTSGNLYGTTFGGGKYIGGTVYELTPQAGGGWTEILLHTFDTGQNPSGRLIVDGAGNLYGTTTNGGSFGKGVVFELSPQFGGGWTYKRLHAFGNGNDGQYPYHGLVFDAIGNLYGATGGGGALGDGTVFELTLAADGNWTERILHTFHNNGTGGYEPTGDLVFDAAGNLYGTTTLGGSNAGTFGNGDGTVFKLTPTAGGAWTYATIHEFGSGTDGQKPFAGVILDTAGNLYGTTNIGGLHNTGTVYELMPLSGGGWAEKVLHNFNDNSIDGNNPLCTLIMDAAGNLYGTTENVGKGGLGTVFKLTPRAVGGWPETILHWFRYYLPVTDGARPYAGVILDASGSLYGTTSQGGSNGTGTVFEITP